MDARILSLLVLLAFCTGEVLCLSAGSGEAQDISRRSAFPWQRPKDFFSIKNVLRLETLFLAYDSDERLLDIDQGLGNRSPSWPFISGDGFRYLSHYVCEERHCGPAPWAKDILDRSLHQKDSCVLVFAKGDFLVQVKEQVLSKLKIPFILFTQNSAVEAPGPDGEDILENPLLRAWFAKNANSSIVPLPKTLIPIPIGVESRWAKVGKHPSRYFKFMRQTRLVTPVTGVYVSFKIDTWPIERAHCIRVLSTKPFATVSTKFSSQDKYLKAVLQNKFTATPRGRGMDSHRLWEVLMLGRYPIVVTSPLDWLYEDLPVLIISKWEDVTMELLEEKYAKFESHEYNFEKVFFTYWYSIIQCVKRTTDISSCY
mmetsp:Transcript_43992/g.71577  ORF Transcript_43992/g.71577 Transcript_43992/m.71577 type:complete len:370 (-) Transcript_43992:189-1298(-)